MRYAQMALTAMVMVYLTGVCVADTLSTTLDGTGYISGIVREQTRGRVLVHHSIPEQVQQSRIDFAFLSIPGVRLSGNAGRVTVNLLRLTTPWSADRVSWTSPWQRAGGDFDTTEATCFALASDDAYNLAFDVTDWAKQWQAGAINCGMILTRPRDEGGGFGDEAAVLRQALAQARVKFYFTPVQQ